MTDIDTDTPDRRGTEHGAALITGGGSGIGLACAQHLAATGLRVTICGRSPDRLRDALATLPPSARSVVADITDEAAMEQAVAVAAEGFGSLAAVVANAGGTAAVGPLALLDVAQFESDVTLNLTGTFVTIKTAAPALAAANGAVVAISSIAGHLTHPLMAAYSASKAGVEMLVRNAADELGRFGIRVNAVRPGLVPTGASDPLATDEATRDDYLAQMPLGRLGTVDDIAATVTFLAGPHASWITGQVLSVDGGHSLRRGPDLSNLLGRWFDDRLEARLGSSSVL